MLLHGLHRLTSSPRSGASSASRGTFSVSGSREKAAQEKKFLYRGIATRSFERQFQLADYVRVVGAELKNGLLHIDLAREVPESMKSRRIEIKGDADPLIENKAEAA